MIHNRAHRVVIAGGAGYLGRALAADFAARAWQVTILSRQAHPDAGPIRFLAWDGRTAGGWAAALDGAEALINLAGRSVNCRYNARNRAAIYASRLDSTRVLGEVIGACDQPPRAWLNASSATIYRHALDRPMDEETGEIGAGFSVDVCQRWEQALYAAETPRTRRVAMRAAMVFGKGRGGVMEAFLRIARLGLGGTLGPGNQYVSWIHLDDFVRAVNWIVEHDTLAGPVNIAAPNPLPNHEFMRALRRACRQPIGLPGPRWMLEVGAFLIRTETELLLKSRRVVPARLLRSGFTFRFPELQAALEEIVGG